MSTELKSTRMDKMEERICTLEAGYASTHRSLQDVTLSVGGEYVYLLLRYNACFIVYRCVTVGSYPDLVGVLRKLRNV